MSAVEQKLFLSGATDIKNTEEHSLNIFRIIIIIIYFAFA